MSDGDRERRTHSEPGATRCGFIVVIGAPNAGKSTLVNRLVGGKVSIVSRKVQTTRTPVRGIAIRGACQLVFVDTPGIFRPRRRLDRAMVAAARAGAAAADVVLVVIDASKGLEAEAEHVLALLPDMKAHKFAVLNKIDRLQDKGALLELAAAITAAAQLDRVFMISALTGDGLVELGAAMATAVPPGPWLYPEDEISDMPNRLLAAEITREKIFERLHDELPYATTVETTAWTPLRKGGVRIEQTIYVERDSQRKIVIGKGGATIKQISVAARSELSDLLEQPVHLFLFVKVRSRWGDDPERYREIGLEYPKD
jgi:GTP-binding protein Era